MNMNMIVSIILESILRTYSVVASDFLEMLNETYCFITMPQNVILDIAHVYDRVRNGRLDLREDA